MPCACDFANECVAQRVGAILIYQHEWIDAVALRFRHLLVVLIAHEAVNIHRLEWHFAGEVARHQRHSCDPEKDDVKAGYKRLRRIVELVVGRVGIRPAEGRHGPNARREPRIEYVRILL